MSLYTPLLHRELLELIRETALVGTRAQGTEHRHKSLLEGCCNLADLLLEDAKASALADHYLSEVELICEAAKAGLIGEQSLDSAFNLIADAAMRAALRYSQ